MAIINKTMLVAGFASLLLCATILPAVETNSAGSYRDPSLPVNQRVEDLLRRMSLDEKVGQLNQKLFGWQCYQREGEQIKLTPYLENEAKHWAGMGTIYGLLRADPWSGVTWQTGIPPEQRVEVLNRVQRLVLENSRWKIPALFSTEAPHGHMALGGDILPTAIGIGSTWNPVLYREAAHAVAEEVRHSGEHLALVACLDIARDPRWGRTEECFGEDPFLTASMARAATLGTQGESLSELTQPDHAAIVLKHFAGQGGSMGAHNASATDIGPRELREIHLPAARAGIQAGAQGIMAAYNEIDGIPCCANPELLTKILREDWGFSGMVMADGGALDKLKRQTGSTEAAGSLALQAGVDLGLWDDAFRTLADSVRVGRLDENYVDRAAARVLRLKFELGLFEHPFAEDNFVALQAALSKTREANLKLARESLVLLRNEGGVLPFKKGLRRIAVIGPNANDAYAQLGDYTPPQIPGECITVLDGIRNLVGPQTEVVYAQGCHTRLTGRSGIAEAAAAARSADAVVVVVGGSSSRYIGAKFATTGAALGEQSPKDMDCGEGVDLANLDLGGLQLELVQALAKTGVPMAVVLIQGRPHSIPWIAEHCPAILCAWYPGQQGGRAIAEALFGDVNPSGRLPISIPRSSDQLPVYYNHKFVPEDAYHDMAGTPLYHFGYGLSYTKFGLSNLHVSPQQITATNLNAAGDISVSVEVDNLGDRAGMETVQVYLQGLESPISRRVRELKAFSKITLAPNERRTVTFKLTREELGIWGTEMQFSVTPGLNEISVQGGACPPLTTKVRID